MSRSIITAALLSTLTLASSAHAGAFALEFAGSLTNTDPTFNRPAAPGDALSGTGTAVAYDTYQFIANPSGPYVVQANYSGTLTDGYLLLYRPSFNPASSLVNLQAGNDDGSGFSDSVLPDASSAGADFGPETAGTTLNLTPGGLYTIVVSGFNNQNFGDYTIGVTGGSLVPEPTTLAVLSGAAVLLLKRRKA